MQSDRSLWLFALPSLALLTVVLLYPLGLSVYTSFFDAYMPRPERSFVGLANYAALFGESRFWASLATTIQIVVAAVAVELVVGFAVAYGLFRLARGAKTLTILMFLPHIITPVVAALFLRWMFVSRWGLIDSTLAALDLFGPQWLADPIWARVTIVIADAWKFTPFMMLVLYAGLQSLDQSLLDAAQIDGATGWQTVWHVILPALRPLMLFVVAIRSMDCFRMFDSIFVLTGGGPGTATETLTYYNYTLAFRMLEMGKASALGVITLAILATLMGGLIAGMYRRERGAF
jgi:multiple sugar transport system permease protein